MASPGLGTGGLPITGGVVIRRLVAAAVHGLAGLCLGFGVAQCHGDDRAAELAQIGRIAADAANGDVPLGFSGCRGNRGGSWFFLF